MGRLIPAVILIGPPGSGKGTQARLLRQQCVKGPHISTGDMLRRHIEEQDAIGRQIRDRMRAGQLVPDELVNRLVEQRIQESDCREGFILDGYPRTVNQASVLGTLARTIGIAPTVLHLVVEYDKLVARLSDRRQCPVCGTLYNLSTTPPRAAGICDREGAVLVTREDDREPAIRERLDEYEMQTQPVVEALHASGVTVFEIDAAGNSPDRIAQSICAKLAGFGSNASGEAVNV